MKIKLSKTIAVVLALCLIFTGFSAFAAEISMVTSYNLNDLQTEETPADVDVITTVKGAAEGDEVTYYVSNGDNIVYINQTTADGGDVVFSKANKLGFSGAWSALENATVVVGTDGSWTGNSAAPMSIVAGGNFMSNASASNNVDAEWETVTRGEENTWLFTAEDAAEEIDTAVVFSGTVAGTYKEYGVRVKFLNAAEEVITVDFPAYGCNEDGSYFVAIKGASDFNGDAVQSVTCYIM